MGRESSTNLEQAALSFLSAIDPERGIDAALFLRRTGLVLASWTREGIRLDVVSVMAATMLASIDTILEALGGSASESVAVEGGRHEDRVEGVPRRHREKIRGAKRRAKDGARTRDATLENRERDGLSPRGNDGPS